MFKKIISFIELKTIPFDLRSLGLFRISLGFAVLYNLIFYRFPAVGIFYNNELISPEKSGNDYFGPSFPLFRLFENNNWYYFLLSLMTVLVVLFIIGWKTKWITPVLFFMFASLVTTNSYLAHGVDFLEEVALFWAMFLPLDQAFTLCKSRQVPQIIFGKIAHFGFQFQLLLIYFSAWIFKDGALWRNGKILEIVSYDLIHARSILQELGSYPLLSQVFTYAGFYLEVIVSILILISIFLKKTRLWTLISILLLHAIMAVFLHVGTFFIIGLAFGLLFLPSSFWDKIVYRKSSAGIQNIYSRPNRSKTHVLAGIFILGVLAFILQGNLHHWSKNSYLTPVLSKVPFYKYTIGLKLPDPGIFTGVWHQVWAFFPNNLYDDLGDFIYVGYDNNGVPYELRTGEALSFKEVDGQVSVTPLPRASYHGAEFTFTVYLKFYQDRFPKSTQEGILELQLEKFEKEHPEVQISKTELWKLQRFHKFENEKLVIKDSLYRLLPE
ncbi:MAG: hypothetical protein ACSHWW_12505 [Nonlabens sp.]|uniref:hypothetical protein n=1 Tax=Nonlabens sp. TaxID=1888209 RepID=UPI003EFA0063